MTKPVLLNLLLAACFALSPQLYAAEEDVITDNTEQDPEEELNPIPDIPTSVSDLELDIEIFDSNDENFVPSIRITEDLPVAFPIDI